MNTLHQWIYNTLIIALTSLLLIGCSGDSKGNKFTPNTKTASEIAFDNWIQMQVTKETKDLPTHFNNFSDLMMGEHDGNEFPLIAKSPTDIVPNLANHAKSLEEAEDIDKLEAYVLAIKNSLKQGDFSKDRNLSDIFEKVTQAFIQEYGPYFTEETKNRILKNRKDFMVELNTYVFNWLHESIEKTKKLSS